MKTVVVIPSRLNSSRLPGKALVDICGIPLIQHVYHRCCLSKGVSKVFVATDSDEIAKTILEIGGDVIMTSSHHVNGTERVAEACYSLDADYIVNVQGDEALVNPDYIDVCVEALIKHPYASASILVNSFNKTNSISDIKTVVDIDGYAMYFSRADIPYYAGSPLLDYLKAYHVVAFRKSFLLKYPDLSKGSLEAAESNEYLRILENGFKIATAKVQSTAISVDTFEDLDYVRDKMPSDPFFKSYMKPNS